MPIYRAPTRDTRFVVNELLKLDSYGNLPGFEAADRDTTDTVIDEAGRFIAEVVAPLNLSGDQEGCARHPDGRVTTPAGFKAAFDRFRESGWGTLAAPEEFGGQGMPHVMGMLVEEYLSAANQAFAMYPGLTNGAISAIRTKGSPEQQALYLPRMVAGEWLGTMNLTEPHCGTDLGMIRTRAVPRADGAYAITGTKIFISAGEHDLTENIIHLVLAKTPDAPDSSKGISLFIVPKVLVDAEGNLGERNAVNCGAIEHKMGIHGNATCVMNYDGATGWMVGEENKGLAAMFIMMNAARLGVGIQGLAQAEVAYQNGVAYALERRQGRALTGPAEPQEKADPIVVHADVRRMLMDAKALTEGLRALCLWGALQVDLSHKAANDEERQAADDLISLLTPVIKGYGTDSGYKVATDMQQVWGGHGYIVENGMEQFVRDARIAQIYEGTNGVQAMDLLGRKVLGSGGALARQLGGLIGGFCERHAREGENAEFIVKLAGLLKEWSVATEEVAVRAARNPDETGAASMDYLQLTGYLCLAWCWAWMAAVSAAALKSGTPDAAFHRSKIATARFYFQRILPRAEAHLDAMDAGAGSLMTIPSDQFAF